MARPRTLTCPDCKTETTTRANPNVRVRCSGCGHMMRAPAIDDPWSGPAKTPAAAKTTPVEATSAATGPRVNRATAVKVRPPAAPTNPPAPAGGPPPRTRAQTKGALGGRARGATGFLGSKLGR